MSLSYTRKITAKVAPLTPGTMFAAPRAMPVSSKNRNCKMPHPLYKFNAFGEIIFVPQQLPLYDKKPLYRTKNASKIFMASCKMNCPMKKKDPKGSKPAKL